MPDRRARPASTSRWTVPGCTLLAAFLAVSPAKSAPSSQPSQPQTVAAPAPVPGKAGGPVEARTSSWQRLSPAERQALAPLSGAWDQLSPTHRKKWLEISRNFPSLQPQEQAKMHQRMREWATLSAEDRARARLNFGKTAEIARELTAAEKLAKWQAYQALTPEQRLKLAEQAKPRNLGAAPAAQPVPAQKLAVLPPAAAARAPRPSEPAQDGTSAEEPTSNQ